MTAQLQEGVQMQFDQVKAFLAPSGSVHTYNSPHLQTQLLFNRALPASAANRATHVGRPPPILIEKLGRGAKTTETEDAAASVGSSLRFSVLSEDRLQAAVRLAKRDLQRRRQQLAGIVSRQRPSQESDDGRRRLKHQQVQEDVPVSKERQNTTGQKEETTKTGAKVLVYTPQKLPLSPRTVPSQSPPTRDPGLGPGLSSQEPQLSREIRRLHKELGTYIQKVEELCDRGQLAEELPEPEEARRAEIRRQEQAARSARIIYMLQRQVKEIQEDLEKLCSQKIKHTKKSRTMDRLAAAHRGAVRALQVFVNQLSYQSESRIPSRYKELGQLIRQLSLCSAKMGAERGCSIPETTIDILQRLEALDSALSKQERSQRMDPRVQNSPHAGQNIPGTSPPRQPAGGVQQARKPMHLRKKLTEKRKAAPRPASHGVVNRSKVLRAGLERLIHTGRIIDPTAEQGEDPPVPNHSEPGAEQGEEPQAPNHIRKPRAEQGEEPQVSSHPRGVLLPKKSKGAPPHHVGFQQPTVSSRQKENQPPQRDASVPWIPASPHASPPRKTAVDKLEPRCLFSVQQHPVSPPDGPATCGEVGHQEPGLSPGKMRQARAEALREVWLEKETSRRLEQLNQLSRDQADRILTLGSEALSPSRRAEDVEHKASNRLQPPLEHVQVTASTELLSNAILDELLEDTVHALGMVELDTQAEDLSQRWLQAPTLETMLLRMEQMERDEDAVRRRFAHISYSDPRFWPTEQDAGRPRGAAGSRPTSPQPIRLTKPPLKQPCKAEIHLGNPVETSVTSAHDDSPCWTQPVGASAVVMERGRGVALSIPASTQRSILQYRQRHDAYLRLVSHEPVGSFDPWVVADSLAEELLAEALEDVAAEFQDACEDYAEAVFTSEFLQPIG